jgi:hypothetical protein
VTKDRIDRKIRFLVDALNRLPGITTYASCGGHRDIKDGLNRVPLGEFYVDFVTPRYFLDDDDAEEEVEASISLIKRSIKNFDEKVILEKDIFPPGKKDRAWGISGKGVDPDDVALRIFVNFYRDQDFKTELAELTKDLPELKKEVDALVVRRGW